MVDKNNPPEGQLEINSENTVHNNVSLPTIILTRIDVSQLKSFKSESLSKIKPSKNLVLKNKKTPSPLKSLVKGLPPKKSESRPRGRPKKSESNFTPGRPNKTGLNSTPKQQRKAKLNSKLGRPRKPGLDSPLDRPRKIEHKTILKLTKPVQKLVKNESKFKVVKSHNTSKYISKQQISTAKNILKQTMLTKKTKMINLQAKKPKLLKKTVKQAPQNSKQILKKDSKQTALKIKTQTPKKLNKTIVPDKTIEKPIDKLTAKPINKIEKPDNESVVKEMTEDELLYDELIKEFESTVTNDYKPVSERTTNITLKPSTGNKPPTVVKGGIIKVENLPADLKKIASPGQQLLTNNNVKEVSSKKRPHLQVMDSPIPSKKPSPWPVSISSPTKQPHVDSPNKIKKKSTNSTKTSLKPKVVKKPQQSLDNKIDTRVLSNKPIINSSVEEIKQSTVISGKHKIGPKRTVAPTPGSFNEEENLSDEYTEEETLENLDYLDDTFSNLESEKDHFITNTYEFDTSTSVKPTITSLDTIKDDEDPNIDLIRILTDDNDDSTTEQPESSKVIAKEITKADSENNKNQSSKEHFKNHVGNNYSVPKEPLVDHQNREEPKVRTIYDLINEVSLQRPSWNLHIIPETNAFCIAQVTKGRLGLPTLKKCIELDAVDYNTKVYIHQYHIKRFDGIYDSEESILALIEEIDSIKA